MNMTAPETSAKLPKLEPAELLLPARFSLNMPALTEVKFATLEFPIQAELDDLVNDVRKKLEEQKNWSYDRQPPYRQLNNALMVFCPVLVHGFERYNGKLRMVAINKLSRDPHTGKIIGGVTQRPEVDAVCELIEDWLDQWLKDADLQSLIKTNFPNKWAKVLTALNAAISDAKWQENIGLDELVDQLSTPDAIGYDVIPAAIIALLHRHTITLQHGEQSHEIHWRKAHNGFKDGLHLISQPIYKQTTEPSGFGENASERETEGFYVYEFDVEVETQSGHVGENGKLIPWVFLKVGMRRFADEMLRDDAIWDRDQTILVALSREQMPLDAQKKLRPIPYDSTLIALPVETEFSGSSKDRTVTATWVGRLPALLDAYALTNLDDPSKVLSDPRKFGNLGNKPDHVAHEYYVVHAEGRKYGGKGLGHNHHVNTGFSLKESTEIIQRVLEAIPDALTQDRPFAPDIVQPKGANAPLALRTYETTKNLKNKGSILSEALNRAIEAAGATGVEIAIVHQNADFLEAVTEKIREVTAQHGGDSDGDVSSLIRMYDVRQAPDLFMPLSIAPLTTEEKKDKTKREAWNKRVNELRAEKVEQWEKALTTIQWEKGTHRMALIESYYDAKKVKQSEEILQIKGAVRQACSNVQVGSQFVTHFKKQQNGKLSTANAGKVQNAVLDLLFRQTGLLYGTPCDLYEKAAGLPRSLAENLDVVAFYHVQKNSTLNRKTRQLTTVIAVRLRADGSTQAIWPGQHSWTPYAQAVHMLGKEFSKNRSELKSNKQDTLLLMDNSTIMQFVRDVLEKHLDAPTLAVIQANWWRNGGKHPRWPQLSNAKLFNMRTELRFGNVLSPEVKRDNRSFENLIGIIRLRMGYETPQYTTGTTRWDATQQTGDLDNLSGYLDMTVPQLMHYFSIGGLATFQERQAKGELNDGYKQELRGDFAYKHAQLVELVPFFVQPDLDNDVHKKMLCRCVHFLRVAPSFVQANILYPYPLHLAKTLLEDLMCIVDAD